MWSLLQCQSSKLKSTGCFLFVLLDTESSIYTWQHFTDHIAGRETGKNRLVKKYF